MLLVASILIDQPAYPQVLVPSGPLQPELNALQPGSRQYQFRPIRYRWKEETHLGEQTAPAIEKEYGGVVDQGPNVERLQLITQRLVETMRRVGPPQAPVDVDLQDQQTVKELPITVKLLKSDDVNAFSVWGGRIYVTQGLLQFVRSDDELAGVLAHELAHTMLHHLQSQSRVQEKAEQVQLAMVLAAIMAGRQVNAGDVMVFTEWAKREVVNTHGRDDEAEADRFGLIYAFESGFNPAGLLTFMERLAHRSVSLPKYELGAARTHPWTSERATALQQQLREWGLGDLLPLKRRSSRSLEVTMTEGSREQTPYIAIAVKVFGGNATDLVKLASPGEAGSLQARAQAMVERLQALFMQGLTASDLYVQGSTLYSRRSLQGLEVTPLFSAEPEDAALLNQPQEEMASRLLRRLQRVFSLETLSAGY